MLYKWDRRAISIPDSLGRLPLGIARSRGHVKLAECLEHLQRGEQAPLGQSPRIHCPPSEEPHADGWMAQWHSEAIASPEIPKGVTVIASTNPGKNSRVTTSQTCRVPRCCPSGEALGCSLMGLGGFLSLSCLLAVRMPSVTPLAPCPPNAESRKKTMSVQERTAVMEEEDLSPPDALGGVNVRDVSGPASPWVSPGPRGRVSSLGILI